MPLSVRIVVSMVNPTPNSFSRLGSTPQNRQQRPYRIPDLHVVLQTPLAGPWPENAQHTIVAMGCFWGTERLFWQIPGVLVTAAGYAGGTTAHPTYQEVCAQGTGHAEAVLVVFDPEQVRYEELLATFWENHDPTTPNRQGNDVGSHYRSALFATTAEQVVAARRSQGQFNEVLRAAGRTPSTTEVVDYQGQEFYYAEADHQQYLHKVPSGYCNQGPNGLTCPIPTRPAQPASTS